MSADQLPNLDDELTAVLAPDGAPSDEAVAAYDGTDEWRHHAGPWQPTSPDDADWVARKAKRARQQVDALVEQRDRLVAQADAWLDRERKRHDHTIAWAEGVLEVWLRAEIAADDSKKPRQSRELPCGVTVKRTSGRPRLVVDDHDALVDWLTSNEDTADLATAEWKVDATKVKQLVTKQGLALKGAHVETGPDSVEVDLGGTA